MSVLSCIDGGRFNSKRANLGAKPLVATSEAIACTLSLPDFSGPIRGMKEIGSVLAIRTRSPPISKIELSTPTVGPCSIERYFTPERSVIVSITLRSGFPRAGDKQAPLSRKTLGCRLYVLLLLTPTIQVSKQHRST